MSIVSYGRKDKVLVTGASGFIGCEVLKSLPKDKVLPVFRRKLDSAMQDGFIIDDFNQSSSWDGAFDDIRSVIHLAGLAHSSDCNEFDLFNVNVEGTKTLAVNAAKSGVKRFVFVSSIGVNGSMTNESPFSENSTLRPHNSYANSKHRAELELIKICRETGMELVIVRPTLVYGAHAPGNFGTLAKLVKKLPILPFGLTNNQRDFIAVQNLADLLITCANHSNAGGHTFLASDGETVSIKEFTSAIAKGLNKRVVQLPFPVSIMRLVARLFGKSAIAEQLLGNLQVDSSNAQDVLGWVAPFTMERAMASLSEKKK